MKTFLINANVQGSNRWFYQTDKELYSRINWKDGYLRDGKHLFLDKQLNESEFLRGYTDIVLLLSQFEEVIEIKQIL